MQHIIHQGLIIGSQIHIAKFGAVIGSGESSKTVSADWLPEMPEGAATAPWLHMGKIRTSKPMIETKTADLEGVNAGGTYETEELIVATKRKFQFTSNYITQEFLQLSFGLINDIQPGVKQEVFASGSPQIDCYVHTRWTDAYRDGAELLTAVMQGRLRLVNPAEAKSDPALAEWELSVVYNPLCSLTPAASDPA